MAKVKLPLVGSLELALLVSARSAVPFLGFFSVSGLYWDSALCLFLDLHSQSLLWQFTRVKFF